MSRMEMDVERLNGTVAILTGASGGIGREIARSLATCGANIVAATHPGGDLSDLQAFCRDCEVECLPVQLELTSPGACDELVTRALKHFGRIDSLINNAGLYCHGPVLGADGAAWDRVLSVNVNVLVQLTRVALPHLLASDRGAVVNMASIAGKFGIADEAIYCASKHAVVGFSHALFQEVRAQGLKVCVLCPGLVNTAMALNRGMAIDRAIPPRDIAQAITQVLLTSPAVCPIELMLQPQESPAAAGATVI